jgi:hypothetical protein
VGFAPNKLCTFLRILKFNFSTGDEDVQMNIDTEVKITEFNYEEFIPAEIL